MGRASWTMPKICGHGGANDSHAMCTVLHFVGHTTDPWPWGACVQVCQGVGEGGQAILSEGDHGPVLATP